MKRTIYSRYLDWNLDTVVRIAAPEDDNDVESVRYFVQGVAKLAVDAKRSLYSSHTEQVFVSQTFTNASLAEQYHDETTVQLRGMIDQLKI